MKDINLSKIKNSIHFKKISSKSELSKNENCDGYLIESSEKEARRIVETLKRSNKKIGIIGSDDAFNRRIIETLKIDYLVSPERGTKTDTIKQRDSGINHVVAKILEKKNITIIIDMSEIKKLVGKKLALRLGRLIQNIKIYRKAGCKIKIASLALCENKIIDEMGRRAFGMSLGMSSEQSFESVNFNNK